MPIKSLLKPVLLNKMSITIYRCFSPFRERAKARRGPKSGPEPDFKSVNLLQRLGLYRRRFFIFGIMAATSTSTSITLRGSTDIVVEFFDFSVNSILYQRGIYPPETFKRVSQYGLPMMTTTDEGLTAYLSNITRQLGAWLMNGSVQKLILVIKGVETGDTLERWCFDCETTKNITGEMKSDKPMKEITCEIQAIIRQITASVTFLPLLNEPCSFDLLVYADEAATVPVTWEDSDPCFIANAEDVRLRSFTTKIHKVDLKVEYKVNDDL